MSTPFSKQHLGRVYCVAVGAALLFSLATGCTGKGNPTLGRVSGVVTLDGKPVKGAVLEFIPQESGKSVAWGSTNENGQYEMAFGQNRKGAFLGRTLVRITSDDHVSIDGQEYLSTEVFPPKYHVKSEQFIDIKEGKNEFDFKCESGAFKPRPPRRPGAS